MKICVFFAQVNVTQDPDGMENANMSMNTHGEPYEHILKSGETAYICQCGHSNTPPFCDGRHEQHPGTAPLAYTATKDETVYICGCDKTGNKPWCDGSHTAS